MLITIIGGLVYYNKNHNKVEKTQVNNNKNQILYCILKLPNLFMIDS